MTKRTRRYFYSDPTERIGIPTSLRRPDDATLHIGSKLEFAVNSGW